MPQRAEPHVTNRLRRATLPLAVVTAFAAAALGSGCGDNGPSRTASGTDAWRHIDTAGVTRVEISSAFAVRLSLGQPEETVVTYDENLADLLDVGVERATLRIRLRPHAAIRDSPTLRADVTIGQLESMRLDSAATVDVTDDLQTTPLRVELSGSSRLAADLNLERAEATVSGASRLELAGRVGALTAEASGASDLQLAALRLEDLDIRLSGASHASVQVERSISAELSGASGLTYQGNPQFTKRDASGASTIRPA